MFTAHAPHNSEWLTIREALRNDKKELFRRNKAIQEGHSLANPEGEEVLINLIRSFFRTLLFLSIPASAAMACGEGVVLERRIRDLGKLTSPEYAEMVLKGILIDPRTVRELLENIIAQQYELDKGFVHELWDLEKERRKEE